MIERYQNTPESALFDIISSEEILQLALDNLQHKKGIYYALINEYIADYKNIDVRIKKKIKKIIILLQKCVKIKGEKITLQNLNICLDKLKAVKNKSLYIRIYSICIKYNTKAIVEAFSKIID